MDPGPVCSLHPAPDRRTVDPAVMTETQQRDVFIDTVRALSLFVVVLWHWVFTFLIWDSDGPHASNPIGATHGLWLATWLLQVMPMFFFAGGYVHKRGWVTGRSGWSWVAKRLSRLWAPALALIVV